MADGYLLKIRQLKSVPPHAFFHYFVDVEGSMGQMFSWTFGGGVYDPDFIAIHEDREKKGQGM
jgi:hypothetical protein